MEYQINIQTARYYAEGDLRDGFVGFRYSTQERFPGNARGLALAVIACRNLLKADAHHIQRSDIAIQFVAPHTEQGHFLADDKFFELVWFANENVSSLFSSCEQFMNKQGYVKAAA